jgi:hypothetical protein
VDGVTASVAPAGFLSVEIRAPDRGVVAEEDVFLVLGLDDKLHAISGDETPVMRVLRVGLCLTELQSWIKSLLKRCRVDT